MTTFVGLSVALTSLTSNFADVKQTASLSPKKPRSNVCSGRSSRVLMTKIVRKNIDIFATVPLKERRIREMLRYEKTS